MELEEAMQVCVFPTVHYDLLIPLKVRKRNTHDLWEGYDYKVEGRHANILEWVNSECLNTQIQYTTAKTL